MLAGLNLKKLKGYADWKLLLFLLLFLNVKLAIKIPAIVIIYILQFDFKFGFKLKNSRLPLFYPLVMVIPFIDLLLNKSYTNPNYLLVFLTGMGFWLLCILAIHQVKLFTEKNEPEVIHRTILIFFVINAVVSLLNMAVIIGEIRDLNPYTYQGQYQKYFIGTGDYIKGLTFDTSTTNAILNAFGVIYFLIRKNAVMQLVCMVTLLFTASNTANILLVLILAGLFLFNTSREQKSMIAVCLVLLIVFMAKISPQNNRYVMETFESVFHKGSLNKPVIILHPVPLTERPDSTLNPEEKKQKIAMLYLDSVQKAIILKNLPKPPTRHFGQPLLVEESGRILIPKADINSAPYQNIKTTPIAQKPLVAFINNNKTALPISGQSRYNTNLPGKVAGALQTVNFLKQHPAKILTGDGMGNFSSKLAFRVTGLGMSGGYPAKHTYINPDFEVNHLDLYLNFFSKRAGYHSLINSPFSVYDQLLAEYGLLGFFALFACYLGFFAKHYKTLTYGLPILALTASMLFFDYWFEQLSVLVFFELMLLLNIKETTVNYA